MKQLSEKELDGIVAYPHLITPEETICLIEEIKQLREVAVMYPIAVQQLMVFQMTFANIAQTIVNSQNTITTIQNSVNKPLE